jgi:MoaA/NifB/PqqE/SkfB family radical SAM enzyme
MKMFLSILFRNAHTQKFIMNSRHFGMPVSVQIEITTKCNLSCPFCLRVTDPARIIDVDMSLNLYKSIINQIKGRTCGVNLVGLGEPLLHPEIFSSKLS